MTALKFTPKVFTISNPNDLSGPTTWDLLTVDGEDPRNTVYFMKKGDAPSSKAAGYIESAIENEEWEECDLEDSGCSLKDFDIDVSIFDTAGEGYAEIRKELKK